MARTRYISDAGVPMINDDMSPQDLEPPAIDGLLAGIRTMNDPQDPLLSLSLDALTTVVRARSGEQGLIFNVDLNTSCLTLAQAQRDREFFLGSGKVFVRLQLPAAADYCDRMVFLLDNELKSRTLFGDDGDPDPEAGKVH
jgi:hypothetical protein